MNAAAVIVIAKEPRAGHVKTRLTPPFTPLRAAELAAAALADTLAAVGRAPAARRVLALDGRPGPWLPPGFEVIPQRSGPLGERLAGAFEDVGGPAFLVGMDTPQLTADLISLGLGELERDDVNAVLGPALDGGYWAIGLRRADPRVFEGVPMSSAATVAAQRRRFAELGLCWRELAELRDVDTAADAAAVARLAPRSRFAAELRRRPALAA